MTNSRTSKEQFEEYAERADGFREMAKIFHSTSAIAGSLRSAAEIIEALLADRRADEPPVSEKLPPLPKPDGHDRRVEGHYSARSMLEYGALCAINERRKHAEPPADGIRRAAENLLDVLEAALEGSGPGYRIRAENALPVMVHVRALRTALTKSVVIPDQEGDGPLPCSNCGRSLDEHAGIICPTTGKPEGGTSTVLLGMLEDAAHETSAVESDPTIKVTP